jgi:hypothetical protein
MMFASAVCSPVPVISTRSEPEPFTVPAMTFAPSFFRTGTDSPVDHRLVDVALALAHEAVHNPFRAAGLSVGQHHDSPWI